MQKPNRSSTMRLSEREMNLEFTLGQKNQKDLDVLKNIA